MRAAFEVSSSLVNQDYNFSISLILHLLSCDEMWWGIEVCVNCWVSLESDDLLSLTNSPLTAYQGREPWQCNGMIYMSYSYKCINILNQRQLLTRSELQVHNERALDWFKETVHWSVEIKTKIVVMFLVPNIVHFVITNNAFRHERANSAIMTDLTSSIKL